MKDGLNEWVLITFVIHFGNFYFIMQESYRVLNIEQITRVKVEDNMPQESKDLG